MSTGKEGFAQAMRAEIEGLVARYEALSKAHAEALAAAREHETARLRGDVTQVLADRERLKNSEADARARLSEARGREALLERELSQVRETLERERAASREALTAVEVRLRASQEAQEAERKAHEQAIAALRKAQAEAIEAERKASREAIEAERKASREAVARAEARLSDELSRAKRLEGELGSVREVAASLGEAFASERAFVEASSGLDGTPLLDALKGALGGELSATPQTYAQLKSRKLDVILTLALKDRGRLVLAMPLTERERAALRRLADAAGCELLSPEHGSRFSAQAMEKASTVQDPPEEGNVVQTLLPGLRLAGTEGALVFPRVVVATGLAKETVTTARRR